MPPESKSKVKKTKQRASNETIKTKAVAGTDDDNDNTLVSPAPTSKSKCKIRPKSRPKSVTKHFVKRPKSRQTVATTKEKVQPKWNATNDDATEEQQQRDQVMAVLEAVLNQGSKTRAKERTTSCDNATKQSKTSVKTKVQPKSRGNSYAASQKLKTKSDKKCKRPKSRPKSRGKGLACKSSKCATAPKLELPSKNAFQTGGGETGGPSTQIIIFGSPNDPVALELLKNLVKKINPQAMESEAKQPSTGPPSEEYVTDQAQLEELYDAMYELTNNVRTIQDSYEKIINSLVSLQHRRKGKKEKATLIPVSPSTLKNQKISDHAPNALAQAPPGSIARFMEVGTRNVAFAELFAQVDALKEGMASFYACFDEGGFFNAANYEHHQITTEQRQSWLDEIRSLALTVDNLLAEYNREVLDMFRIESNTGSN